METLVHQNVPVICFCALSAFVVGLSGIVPLFFIPLTTAKHLDPKGLKSLNRWLSYAAGSLLGEVFIHLLPEIWSSHTSMFFVFSLKNQNVTALDTNLLSLKCLVAGLLFFFTVEKIFAQDTGTKQVDGYLNLFANIIDNFTHGIAIGGSYLVSFRLGLVTTLCILIHEIPHEMGDFVILLRSGFTRWQAVKGQLTTASGCLFGAMLALALNNTPSGWSAEWILPFTSGGFLYIALVSLIPDLLKEGSARESLVHVILILLGLTTMLVMAMALD
ncbi:hypothetical protein T265_03936 [Opisthorchis viverrini]|uniref:Metal cation transporter, ZIP family n=2 Tax=Opisthorchis viverrini TaxID=6198 RepID=A0A075A1N5_OPIVI|nr:hypothetical protein T265_03936 [Opisthorchis viverrini]KER29470.1 hypothetical protein T265_03936 [Opisthorchis viverrini]